MRHVNGYELPRILVPHLCERLGLTRAQIRTEVQRGNWQTLARGVVLTRPDEPSRTDWAAAGLTVAGRTAALSGWDALRAQGLAPKRASSPNVLVLTSDGRSRQLGPVRIRRSDRPFRADLTSANHPTLPFAQLVAPARAVADGALECRDLPAARSLVAAALQRHGCGLADIAAELDAGPRNNSALLRQAVHDLSEGARSTAEASAARKLRRADVPAYELNVPVVDERGLLLFVVDVLWRELRAALEIDSRECHFSDADWQATLARHNELTRFGLAITHYPPSRTDKRGDPWLAEVSDWLHRRASELGVGFVRGTGALPLPASGVSAPFVVRRSWRPTP